MEIYNLIGKGRFGHVYSGKLKRWNVALKFSSSKIQLEIEKNIYGYLQQQRSHSNCNSYPLPFFFH